MQPLSQISNSHERHSFFAYKMNFDKVCKVRFRYKLFIIQLQLKCIYIVVYFVNDLYDGWTKYKGTYNLTFA